MSRFQCFIFFEKVNKKQLKIKMSTFKDNQTSIYCHFNKMTERPGSSFQSPALRQKHVRNVCHTAH